MKKVLLKLEMDIKNYFLLNLIIRLRMYICYKNKFFSFVNSYFLSFQIRLNLSKHSTPGLSIKLPLHYSFTSSIFNQGQGCKRLVKIWEGKKGNYKERDEKDWTWIYWLCNNFRKAIFNGTLNQLAIFDIT